MGNHNSGRRPKPTSLKLLRGVSRRDRLNPHEPKPPVGPVEQPETLSAAAGIVWGEVAPVCLAMGTLTSADVPAFAGLCELEACRRQASACKDTEDFVMFTTDGKVHPSVRLERETLTALRPYFDYFGMNPASRSRIVVQQPETPASKWEGLVG